MNDLMRVIPEGALWDGTQAVMLDHTTETRCAYMWIEDDKLLVLTFFGFCDDCEDEHIMDEEYHMLDTNPIPELWAGSEHKTAIPWIPVDDPFEYGLDIA